MQRSAWWIIAYALGSSETKIKTHPAHSIIFLTIFAGIIYSAARYMVSEIIVSKDLVRSSKEHNKEKEIIGK